jgi:hypothetical protein
VGRREVRADGAWSPRYDGAVAEEQQPLAQQLEEIGARLDWVRDYL